MQKGVTLVEMLFNVCKYIMAPNIPNIRSGNKTHPASAIGSSISLLVMNIMKMKDIILP